MMFHFRDHIIVFGCCRLGDTHYNETLNRTTASTYSATKRKLEDISENIIAVRSITESEPPTLLLQRIDLIDLDE